MLQMNCVRRRKFGKQYNHANGRLQTGYVRQYRSEGRAYD